MSRRPAYLAGAETDNQTNEAIRCHLKMLTSTYYVAELNLVEPSNQCSRMHHLQGRYNSPTISSSHFAEESYLNMRPAIGSQSCHLVHVKARPAQNNVNVQQDMSIAMVLGTRHQHYFPYQQIFTINAPFKVIQLCQSYITVCSTAQIPINKYHSPQMQLSPLTIT